MSVPLRSPLPPRARRAGGRPGPWRARGQVVAETARVTLAYPRKNAMRSSSPWTKRPGLRSWPRTLRSQPSSGDQVRSPLAWSRPSRVLTRSSPMRAPFSVPLARELEIGRREVRGLGPGRRGCSRSWRGCRRRSPGLWETRPGCRPLSGQRRRSQSPLSSTRARVRLQIQGPGGREPGTGDGLLEVEGVDGQDPVLPMQVEPGRQVAEVREPGRRAVQGTPVRVADSRSPRVSRRASPRPPGHPPRNPGDRCPSTGPARPSSDAPGRPSR